MAGRNSKEADEGLGVSAKLLLLAALLKNDRIISNNGKAFLKELILRRDSRLDNLLHKFEHKKSGDSSFLETLHELIMEEARSTYDELFGDTTLEVGKTLSKTERDSKQLTEEKSLIYGEVEFDSFYRVLRKINPPPGLVFYDLGSGTGKAVFAARFAYDFSKCIGVEILSSLHRQALSVLQRYESKFKPHLAMGQPQHVMVYEGSFLDYDWSDGDLVFANSTCFDDFLMGSLSDMAGRLKAGAIVVTFTKGMTNASFELLERKRYRMSWGPATVFIHRKLNADGSPVGPAHLNILPSDSITYDEEKPATVFDPSSPFDDIDDDDDDGDDESDDDEEDIDVYISQKPAGEEQHSRAAPSPLSQKESSVGSTTPQSGSSIQLPSPPGLTAVSPAIGSSSTKASPSALVGNKSFQVSPSLTSSREKSISTTKEVATPSVANLTAPKTPSTVSPSKIPKPETPPPHSVLSPQQSRNLLSSAGSDIGELSSPTCMNSPYDSGLLMRKRAAPRKSLKYSMPPKVNKVEVELKKLTKLDGNKTCADCPEKMPSYADLTHNNFVCTKCAGIHRDFQFKVKGISMSVFTETDVAMLASVGNTAFNAKYLAKYSDRESSPNGSDIVKLKEFIRMKYMDKKWYSESSSASIGSSSSAVHVHDTSTVSNSSSSIAKRSSIVNPTPAPTTNTFGIDLLSISEPVTQTAVAAKPSTFDPFGANVPPNGSHAFDAFSNDPVKTTTTGNASFDPFGAPPAATNSFQGFDAFASPPHFQQPPPTGFTNFGSAPSAVPVPPAAPLPFIRLAPPPPVAAEPVKATTVAPKAVDPKNFSAFDDLLDATPTTNVVAANALPKQNNPYGAPPAQVLGGYQSYPTSQQQQQPISYPYPQQPQPYANYPPQQQHPGYPPQPPTGHPLTQPQTGYPPQQHPGYQQTGYPPQQHPGYQQTGYPPQQHPGYPPQQQQVSYPQQQQVGYPQQHPGYPPQQQQQSAIYPPQQYTGYPPTQQQPVPTKAEPAPTPDPFAAMSGAAWSQAGAPAHSNPRAPSIAPVQLQASVPSIYTATATQQGPPPASVNPFDMF